MEIGPYRGEVAPAYGDTVVLEQFAAMRALVQGDAAVAITAGRNRIVRVELRTQDGLRPVAVKAYGCQSLYQDRRARRIGSKAKRTWLAARHLVDRGVGTPEPLAYLDRWEGRRLRESYVVTAYQDQVLSFTDALAELFYERPRCELFMALMQRVADAIRSMHAAGFQHNDLGNQNILLRRLGDADWCDVQFIDLNRGRIRTALTLEQRARDLSRIFLPSDLMRVFREMYFDDVVPAAFVDRERWFRANYAWHDRTRRFRHPFREARKRREACGTRRLYPKPKDMWIWDERSAQAISTMRPRDRHRLYSPLHPLKLAAATLRGAWPVWRHYRDLLSGCYQAPVAMAGCVGMAVNPRPDTWERERALLTALGPIPVLLRFYHHETIREWTFLAACVHELAGNGHAVSVALVQSRRAVTEPDSWATFVSYVLSHTAGCVEQVEVGHAINRVKWGLWDSSDYRRLTQTVATVSAFSGETAFMGPAVIDFEYPDAMAALAQVSSGLHFRALSHHLYVDRRGAPENYQGRFATLEKVALARAVARWSPVCDDRLVISEVNWPLRGTGAYSPVTSPYESPGPRHNDPSVTEDVYADYMLRYLLITICSGMAERVYWWRLVARGFGLVDDSEPGAWRERPAYGMLRTFLQRVAEARFVRREVPAAGCHLFRFTRETGDDFAMAYCEDGEKTVTLDAAPDAVQDALGRSVPMRGATVTLTSRPLYLDRHSSMS